MRSVGAFASGPLDVARGSALGSALEKLSQRPRQEGPIDPIYVGLLDSRDEDEKIEMFLSRGEGGEPCLVLRSVARSGMGWFPRKTLLIHPEQLQALEILVKRARGLLADTDHPATECEIIPLPWLGCPAVAE